MLVQHREGEEGVPVLPCTSPSPGATVPSPCPGLQHIGASLSPGQHRGG